MRAVFTSLVALTLITALVWAVTLWHWDRSLRDVSTVDIVSHLLLLPVLLFGGLLLLRAAWVASGRRVAARGGPTSDDVPPAVDGHDDAARATAPSASGPVCVLATRCHTALVAPPAAWPTALRQATLHPGPDALLRDEDDRAPFSTRVWPAGDAPCTESASRLQRCLALLEPCCELLDSADTCLSALLERLPPPAPGSTRMVVPSEDLQPGSPATAVREAHAHKQLSLQAAARLPGAPQFEVWLALPDVHSPAHRTEPDEGQAQPARAWIAPRLGAMRAFDPHAHTLVCPVLGNGIDLLQQVHARLRGWQSAGRSGLLLLMVADSLIDSTCAAELARAGQVVDGVRNRGLTLGEAAVGLLLATSGDGVDPTAPPPVALGEPALGRRAQAADADTPAAPQTAQRVLADALKAGASSAALLVSDADLRPGRATELYSAVLDTLPDLDAGEAVAAFGACLGHLGGAGPALALAMAADGCATSGQPTAWLSVGDPWQRAAGLLWPLPST